MAIGSIDPSTPTGADPVSEGDNQFNALKLAIKDSFVGFTGTPAGNDVVATKTGPQIEDGAEKSAAQTISGAWTFDISSVTRFDGFVTLDNEVSLSGVDLGQTGSINLIKRNTNDDVEVGEVGSTLFMPSNAQVNGAFVASGNLDVSGNLTIGGQFRPVVTAGGAVLPTAQTLQVFDGAGLSLGFIRIWES